MVYSPVNPWTFPVNPNFPWLPKATVISAITNANPAVVTTTTNHGYSDGLIVRVVLPFPYFSAFGMIQINGLSGPILVLSPTTFSVAINTLTFDPFVVGTSLENAQIIPIGMLADASINDDFTQVNPVNPQTGVPIPLFQRPGLQAPGACSTSQT
jgi:hypothetical protein